MSESPWEPLNEDFETPEPEYITTDHDMTDRLDAAYVEALIEKYGDVGELTSTVDDDDTDAPDYSELDPDFYDDYQPE